jgi:undecaprenyl-diphosphatase
MDWLLAAAAGILQGLTEFLPVSSSGHLVLFHELFGFSFSDDVLFDVAMHLATAAALLVFFRRDILRLVRGFLRTLNRRGPGADPDGRLAWLIALGTVPAVLAGAFFDDLIETRFRSVAVVAAALAVVALLFFVAEKLGKRKRRMEDVRLADAAAVGLAQALALVPGVSRSGITIVAGLARGLKRDEAARFSFLLSIPAVLGAGAKKVFEVPDWSQADGFVLGVGFAAAFVTGLVVLRFFLGFLGRRPLHVFAWYRIALASVLLVLLLAR